MQSVPETAELSVPTDLSGHIWVQELPTGGWLRFQVSAAGGLRFGTPGDTAASVLGLPAPYRRAGWQIRSSLDREILEEATDDPEAITFIGRASWNRGLAYPWQETPAFVGTDVWSADEGRYLPPDQATTAFDRLGLPTPPAIAKEQSRAHTDLTQYIDHDQFPSSAWRDGRVAGILVRDKTGTRTQRDRPITTDTDSDQRDPSADVLATQYTTETRVREAATRVKAAGQTPSVQTVRNRIVADIAREHYPTLYRAGDAIVSMQALDSAIAETVQRYLEGASESVFTP